MLIKDKILRERRSLSLAGHKPKFLYVGPKDFDKLVEEFREVGVDLFKETHIYGLRYYLLLKMRGWVISE
jgi:hypothetical protein